MILLDALAGRDVPRRPLWIMRQAGRWLPEYRELRRRIRFEELCAKPDLAARVTLMPLERFPFDAAIVFADLVTPLAALGIEHRFDPGPVALNPVTGPASIERLAEPGGVIAPSVCETLRSVRGELAPGTALLGFAGAPWSLALYCLDGTGGERIDRLRALARDEPAALGELLGRLARLGGRYLREQAEAGADAVQVFDTWAGLLGREAWERLVRPHLVTLLEEAGGAGVPRIVFLKGAPQLVEAYAALPCECVSVDWTVDMGALRSALGPTPALQGNVDPSLLLEGPDAVRAAASRLLASVPREGHVVNLGHGILPSTPIESVAALVETVHAEARA